VGKRVFFTADDGVHGRELWRSDGTRAGTVLVKDITSGVAASYPPSDLTDVRGTLFLVADDGVHGQQLWKSDGTRTGTVPLTDLKPPALGGCCSAVAAVGARLYFTLPTSLQLWRSDGTRAGTVLVKDMNSSTCGGVDVPYMDYLTDLRGTLFFNFNCDGGLGGDELWRSDGTRAGTVPVDNGLILGGYANPDLIDAGGTLYFAFNNGFDPGPELWRSDGTSAGTGLVRELYRSGDGPAALTNVGGRVFFTADDGVHPSQLWRSNGTRAGTVPLTKNTVGVSSYPAAVGRRAFFAAGDGVHGKELWRSDGSPDGTMLVKDIKPGVGSSNPSNLTDVGGRLFFTADDGVHGRELWKSDGTKAGTVLVKDIDTQPGL
jgi:ELWxxDGT repeat protein